MIGLIAVIALVLSIICMTRCKTDKFGTQLCSYGEDPYELNTGERCNLVTGKDIHDNPNTLCCGHYVVWPYNYYFCDPLGDSAASRGVCEG